MYKLQCSLAYVSYKICVIPSVPCVIDFMAWCEACVLKLNHGQIIFWITLVCANYQRIHSRSASADVE